MTDDACSLCCEGIVFWVNYPSINWGACNYHANGKTNVSKVLR